MIPIRDTIQSKNYPVVNSLIILINALLFLVQTAQGEKLNQFIFTYGLVPARFSIPEIAAYFTTTQQILSLFSFMFIHGGFWHLLGNMWSLYIFGDNVEDRLGPIRYLLFYILCGLTSGLSHLFINWHSHIPTVGASGAIAGVMGAYMILYPSSRILTLIPIFFLPYFVEIPAYFFLGLWFILQFISAAGTPSHGGGIAWWAHIGGFLFGMMFLYVFLKSPKLGITPRIGPMIAKKKTPRLQVIRTSSSAEDPHLYGSITITSSEARLGTRKLVNIPSGFQKRLFRVRVPPGVGQGTVLRLAGMGKTSQGEVRGNLYLKVEIREKWED
jgi:membrane associated rhomboid family serine protease